MAFTFNADLSDDISQVRFKVGQTDVATSKIEDASIQYFLDEGMTVTGAAAKAARFLHAWWTAKADVTVDDQMQRVSQIAKGYLALALQLELESAASTPSAAAAAFSNIMVGGLTDRRGPLHDCPESSYDFPDCC